MIQSIKKFFILTSVIYLIFSYNSQPKRVHIFIDYATFPTILQMTEFIKLPEQDIKIIGWNRYPNRNQIIKKHNLQKNVIDISSLLEYSYKEKQESLSSILNGIEQNHSNTLYELHLNYKHFEWGGVQLLKLIPAHQIKQIHLYEDGAGTLYKEINDKKIQNFGLKFAEQFALELAKYTPSPRYHANAYAIAIPILYPVTYHTTIAHKVRLIKSQPFYKHFKNLTITDVDFKKLKTELTPKEKIKLYQLLDIDFSKIEKHIQADKPLGLFMWDGKYLSERYKATNKLLDKMEEHTKKYGTIWFSKNHPTVQQPYLPRPFLKPLPSHFPMEVLFLSDYPFQYVAGAGSSAFYSLKADEIIAYIPNHHKFYVKSLIDLKILDKEKIFYW